MACDQRTYWLFSALLLGALLGCAPRAKLQVWRPAEQDIAGVEKLAILDLAGQDQSGRIARSALVAQFAENRHYTLVDPAVLAQHRPITLADGSPDEGAALEAARNAGVDAILTGQVVSYNVFDDEQHDSHISFGGSGGGNKKSGASFSAFGVGIDNNNTLTREASVSLAVKLIDVQSGQVLAARQAAHSYNGKVVNGDGNLPTRERILTELLQDCSKDVVHLIAPHYTPTEVVLARQYYGAGLSDLRRGNSLASKGDWQGATAAWEKARAANPKNHAAIYNLAVAAEARQDYPGALRLADEALKNYGSSLYHEGRKQMEHQQTLYLAAARQVDAKRTTPSLATRPAEPPTTQPANFQQPTSGSPAGSGAIPLDFHLPAAE